MKTLIAIPSKGRPKSSVIAALYETPNVKVFIEPQDVASYDRPNAVVLDKNDMGIGYARKFILDWSRQNGYEYTALKDDDIDEHYCLVDHEKWKFQKVGMDAIVDMVDVAVSLMVEKNIALLGFNHIFNATRVKQEWMYFVNVGGFCIIQNAAELAVGGYDPTLRIFEDLDLNIKMMLAGYITAVWSGFPFRMPTYGAVGYVGGCADDYMKRREEFVALIAERYPFYNTPYIRRSGYLGIRTSWKKIKADVAKKYPYHAALLA